MKAKKAILLTLAVLVITVLISAVASSIAGRGYNKKRNIKVMFYNVENLFDIKKGVIALANNPLLLF